MSKLVVLSIVILLCLLVVSLLYNYFFYKKAFIPLQQTRLDPMGLNIYPERKGEQSQIKPVFLFFGDSRALSWPNPENKTFHYVNRAIGGQTSEQIINRFNKDVTPFKPKTILLQACVNDLKSIPIFPSQKEQIISQCKRNLDGVLERAKATQARVILTTIFPLDRVDLARRVVGIKAKPIVEAIKDVNGYIHSLAGKDVYVFDAYELLRTESDFINPHFSADWLHLNTTAYEYLNQHLQVFMLKYF